MQYLKTKIFITLLVTSAILMEIDPDPFRVSIYQLTFTILVFITAIYGSLKSKENSND